VLFHPFADETALVPVYSLLFLLLGNVLDLFSFCPSVNVSRNFSPVSLLRKRIRSVLFSWRRFHRTLSSRAMPNFSRFSHCKFTIHSDPHAECLLPATLPFRVRVVSWGSLFVVGRQVFFPSSGLVVFEPSLCERGGLPEVLFVVFLLFLTAGERRPSYHLAAEGRGSFFFLFPPSQNSQRFLRFPATSTPSRGWMPPFRGGVAGIDIWLAPSRLFASFSGIVPVPPSACGGRGPHPVAHAVLPRLHF